MINIDGIDYNVPITKIGLTADFLDKFAQRTQTGDLQRELIGVFFNQELQFGIGNENGEFGRLFDKLTEPVEFHEVSLYTPLGQLTFTIYTSNVKVEMLKAVGNDTWWSGLTCRFTAKAPNRS